MLRLKRLRKTVALNAGKTGRIGFHFDCKEVTTIEPLYHNRLNTYAICCCLSYIRGNFFNATRLKPNEKTSFYTGTDTRS
jgi:hypothetical protein